MRAYAWQVILAQQGVVNSLFGMVGLGPYVLLNSVFGTVVGYLTLTLPLVIILQTLSMSNVDRSMIEAAWNLGCSRLRTVFTVIIPMAKVGLIIGALFCFILSFGDFVSPYYLGGSKPPTLSILIIDTTKSTTVATGRRGCDHNDRDAVCDRVYRVTLAYRKPRSR